ncbi:hypothetical protein [Microbacterium sp. A1-JK]|uniref:hypothetical protein n=1 Tax=Microbacterium sp. A1-JK TaxID=3177516 RepID=UPI003885D99A
MIASLIPHPELAPVPRVEIRLSDLDVYDGGSPSSAGADNLDGGGPGGTGTEADGGPSALTVVDIPDGTDHITVWRTVDGVAHKVQGAVERPYSGALGVLDHGAPPNALSAYELECTANGEPNGRVPLGSTTLGADLAAEQVIIQQPFNPNLNAIVRNMSGSWPAIVREAPGESIFTEGNSLPLFVGFGPLSGVQALEIDFEAEDRAAAARVWATLGTPANPQLPIWLIRAPNAGLMPRVFYGRVTNLQEIDVTVGISDGTDGGGISRFRATLQQVHQPNPALVVPSLTYPDLAAALGGTYTGIAAVLPRYSDWATAWEYSGAAG